MALNGSNLADDHDPLDLQFTVAPDELAIFENDMSFTDEPAENYVEEKSKMEDSAISKEVEDVSFATRDVSINTDHSNKIIEKAHEAIVQHCKPKSKFTQITFDKAFDCSSDDKIEATLEDAKITEKRVTWNQHGIAKHSVNTQALSQKELQLPNHQGISSKREEIVKDCSSEILLPPGEVSYPSCLSVQEVKPVCTIAPSSSSTCPTKSEINTVVSLAQRFGSCAPMSSYQKMASNSKFMPQFNAHFEYNPFGFNSISSFGSYSEPIPPPQSCYLPPTPNMYAPPAYPDPLLMCALPKPIASTYNPFTNHVFQSPHFETFESTTVFQTGLSLPPPVIPSTSVLTSIPPPSLPPVSVASASAHSLSALTEVPYPVPVSSFSGTPISLSHSTKSVSAMAPLTSVIPPPMCIIPPSMSAMPPPISAMLPPMSAIPPPISAVLPPMPVIPHTSPVFCTSTISPTETTRHPVLFSNIFRYIHSNEFKKIISVCGNVKFFKFNIQNNTRHYGIAEVVFSTQAAALRAMRLLSSLTVGGSRIEARSSKVVPDGSPLSDQDKEADLECMVTIGNLLQKMSRIFRWNNPLLDVSKPAITPAPASSINPLKRSNSKQINEIETKRSNLITINLSSQHSESKPDAFSPVSDSQAIQTSSSDNFSQNSNSNYDTPKTAIHDPYQDDVHKPTNKFILANIGAINQKLNDRRKLITSEIDKLYSNKKCEQRRGAATALSVRVHTGTVRLLDQTVKDLQTVFDASAYWQENELVLGVSRHGRRLVPLLYDLLHEYRLLNARISVTVASGAPKQLDKPTPELHHVTEAIKQALELHDSQAKRNIEMQLSKNVLDVYQFKLNRCAKNCDPNTCTLYHSHNDWRRDPRLNPYRAQQCPAGRSCSNLLRCPLCHTDSELLMHPDNFLREVCQQWHIWRRCPWMGKRFCFDAHPESPDMFYHRAWTDLYVTGLYNTFLFVAGAIRNLYQLEDDAVSGLPVLAVSPEERVVAALTEALAATAKRHGVRVTTVTSGEEDPSGAHVLLGTPHGLLKLFQRAGCSPLRGLRALVLDDASATLRHESHRSDLVMLVGLLFGELETPADLHKVVVTQDAVEEEVLALQSLLDTTFRVVERRLSPAPPSRSPPCNTIVSSDDDGLNNVSAKSWSDGRERPRTKELRHSSRSSSRESEPHTTWKRLRADTDRSPQRVDDDHSLTPHRFLEDKKKLRVHVDEEYKVYIDMPEMHPDYEELMEEFTRLYYRPPAGEEDSLWMRFWGSKMTRAKEKEFKDKKKGLIEKYKADSIQKKKNLKNTILNEAEEQPSSFTLPAETTTASELPSSSVSSVYSFSVVDAYDSLTEVSDRLGVLGPPLLRLLRQAREADDRREALAVFTRSDNVTLIKMCAERLRGQLSSVSALQATRMLHAITVAEQLLQHERHELDRYEAGRRKVQELDVQSIARLTLGQLPADIVKSIRTMLGPEGNDCITKEELNEIFISISSWHLKFTLDEEAIKDLPSTQSKPVKPIRESEIPLPGQSTEQSNAVVSSSSSAVDSWFVVQIKNIIATADLSMDRFNTLLCHVFTKRPRNYTFSEQDLALARDLQQLSNFNLTKSMFIFALKKFISEL